MHARTLMPAALLALFALAFTGVGLGPAPGPGPAPTAQQSPEPTNTMCPVMTDEEVDPEIFTEYQGHKVYFCCKRCLRKFERNPQEYVVNLASFSPQQEHTHETDEPAHDDGAAADAETGDGAHAEDDGHEHDTLDEHTHADGESHDTQPASSEAEHEHEHDHGSELPAFLQWLGRFHPASVNFPIGLLVAAALAELLFIGTRRAMFATAARFCIWIGALGALGAAALGWLFGGLHLIDSDWIMTTHRWLGTSTAIVALIGLASSEFHHRKTQAPTRTRLYRVMLFLGALLVSATGFLGGAMLYGIDHYAW